MDDQIPANIEAEEAILGGIIFDPKAIDRIKDTLPVRAFYITRHQMIYQACLTLKEQDKVADYIILVDWFQSRNLIEEVGGTAKLAQLMNRTVSAVNVDRYAKLVLDKYLRREIIALGHQIVEIGYNPHIKIDSVYQEIKDLLPEQILSQQKSPPKASIKSVKYQVKHPTKTNIGFELEAYTEGSVDLDALMVELEGEANSICRNIWKD